MNSYNIIKQIIVIILLLACCTLASAQDKGKITITTKLIGLKASPGMDDHENKVRPPGYRKPDLWFFLERFNLKINNFPYPIVNGTTTDRFYENQWSSTFHNVNHTIINNTITGEDLELWGQDFDLANDNTLRVDYSLRANEEDYHPNYPFYPEPWDYAYLGDDDYGLHTNHTLSLLYFVQNGENNDYLNHKLYYNDLYYKYYFTAFYDIDAIQPHLRVTDSDGTSQDKFCVGDQITLTAEYKGPFKNGKFHWQKDTYGNGYWQHIGYLTGNSITDYVTNSATKYRCRLVANGYNYGVSDFDNDDRIAQFAPNFSLTVDPQITGLEIEALDACPQDSGYIRLTQINAALDGRDYLVQIRANNSFIPYDTTIYINSYSSNYLLNNEVAVRVLPGEYEVLVSAYNGKLACGRTEIVTITDSKYPDFAASGQDPFCFESNGSIKFSNIIHKSPNPPFQYTLRATTLAGDSTYVKNINSRTDSLFALAGSYTLAVENSDGCISESPDTITLAPQEEVIISIAPLDSFEINNVFYNSNCRADMLDADINITGGAPPYDIILTAANPANNRTFRYNENQTMYEGILGHGTNTIVVMDSYGCTSQPYVVIVNNPSPLIFPSITSINPNVICGMTAYDGEFIQTTPITGGTPPYTLYFGGVEVPDFNIDNLSNTNTTMLIVDSLGCQASLNVAISNNDVFSFNDEVYPSYVSCDDQAFELQLFINYGAPLDSAGYLVLVNGVDCATIPNCSEFHNVAGPSYPASGGVIFSTTVPGPYVFDIIDSAECKLSKTYIVKKQIPTEAIAVSAIPPGCPGGIYQTTFMLRNFNYDEVGNQLATYYSLDGGSANYATIDMSKDPAEFTIPVTGDGLHTLVLTGDQGCIDTFTFSLDSVQSFDITVGEVKNLRCENDTTGSIAFHFSGNGPYTFDLFLGPDSITSIYTVGKQHVFSNLAPGTYTIEGTTSGGCTTSQGGIVITSPTAINATVSNNNLINCTGINGEITVSNVSGGTAPYSYSLNNKMYQVDSLLTGAKIENNIVIQDSLGCYQNYELSIPPAGPTLFSNIQELYQATDCSNGAAVIELQAGFTFPITIKEIQDPTNYSSPNISEFGDSLSSQVYRDTFYQLRDTVHYFLIQDGLGCETLDSITISKAAPLVATVTAKANETCTNQSGDGSITIAISGGLPPYMACNNVNDTITTNLSVTFDSLIIAPYRFIIKDQSGCAVTVNDSIDAGSIPTITSAASNFVGCAGDSLFSQINITGLNGQAPYSFLWEDGDTTNSRPSLIAREYHVTITDANGCFIQETVFAPSLDSLNLSLNATTDNICQTDSIGTAMLSTFGGFTPYQFSADGGQTFQTDSLITGLASGNNEIIVQDDHGCFDTTDVNIIFTNPLAADVSTENVNCNSANNGGIEITVTNGVGSYSYSIDSINYQPQNIFNNVAPGTYTAWVQDASGCRVFYENYVITEPAALNLNTTLINNENCGQSNGSASSSFSGGTAPYTFEWDGNPALNDSTLTNAAAGIHTLIITDANACTSTSMVTINNTTPPVLSIENSTSEICGTANAMIDLNIQNGTAPYTINWSHDPALTDSIATDLAQGNYAATVTDTYGCSSTTSITINEIAGPTLSVFSESNSTCSDDNGSIVLAQANGTAPYNYSWSHNVSLNDSIANNLAAGSYTTTVTDANGCSSIISSSIAFEAPPTISTPVVSNAFCGQATGSINVTTSGGTAPITYAWSHDLTLNNPEAINLPQGNYNVTVTDGIGCTDVISNINVGNDLAPDLTVSAFSNADCLSPQGSITVQPVGGTAPFTYTWSHNAGLNNASATGLATGTYTCTVTDSNGCQDLVSQTILTFQGSSSVTGTLACFGDASGSISINMENDPAGFSYAWSDPTLPDTADATNLVAGTYSVTVTNTNGCTLTFTENIQSPFVVTANIASSTPVACIGTLGNATAQANGGTGSFTYLWNDTAAQTTVTANNLPAGNYDVVITDTNGCSATTSVEITTEIPPSISATTITDAACELANGVINISASGGTPPYQYDWSHDSNLNAASANNLLADSYAVTITDATGCTTEQTNMVVNNMATPTLDIASFNNGDCLNPTGDISVQPNGGTAPFTYSWSHDLSLNSSTANNLASGNYEATVTDINGCSATVSQSIITFVGSSEITNELVCSYGNDGAIAVSLEGNLGDYTYAWSDPSLPANPTATGLSEGTYTVTVTNANACTLTFTETIQGPPVLQAAINNSTPVGCTGTLGSATVNPSGGTAPFTYSWNDASSQTTSTANNLPVGNYEVLITDSNACTTSTSVEIVEEIPPTISAPIITTALCEEANGSIVISGTGGTAPYQYNWNHDPTLNAAIANNLLADTYAVTITDATGCTAELTNMVVNNIASPTLAVASFNNTDCLNPIGDITVQATGGNGPFTYSWSHDLSLNSTTANNLTSGDYDITVTDANGCEATVSQSLISFVGSSGITNNLDCSYDSDGSIAVTLEGNLADYNYAWSDPSIPNGPIASGLPEGTYSVTVTNTNSCTQVFTETIQGPPVLQATIGDSTLVGCNASLGSATVSPNGGTAPYTYTWNDAATQTTMMASNLPLGNYEVLVTDANACTTSTSVEITGQTPPSISPPVINSSFCELANGSITIAATGGVLPYQYNWSHDPSLNSAEANNLIADSYSVTITGATGCTAELTNITVNNQDSPTLDIASFNNADCVNVTGDISVQTNGGTAPFTYSWSHDVNLNSNTANNLISGNYEVTVTDGNGCEATISQSIITFVGSSIVTNELVCSDGNDGAIAISLEGNLSDYDYAWSDPYIPNSPVANGLPEGTYTVTVTNANACTMTFTETLQGPPVLQSNIDDSVPVGCNGSLGAASVSATGGTGPYTYVWNDASAQTSSTANNLAIGNYEVLVTDANGCTTMNAIEIVLAPAPIINAPTIAAETCNQVDGSISLSVNGGTAPYTFDWSHDVNLNNPMASNLSAGTYQVTVNDAFGCSQIFNNIQVNNEAAPSLAIAAYHDIDCINSNGSISLDISGGTAPFSYNWSHDAMATGTVQDNLITGNYSITVTDGNGCQSIVSQSIIEFDGTSAITNNLVCADGTDGSIEVNMSGDPADYNYQWSDNTIPNSPFANNLTPGTYSVTVTNNNSCTLVFTETLNTADPLVLSLTDLVPVGCGGVLGSATTSTIGGTGGYTYLWNDAAAQTTASASNLPTGNYELMVTDAVGCTAILGVEILNSSAVVLMEAANIQPSCAGESDGSLVVVATTGQAPFTYLWDDAMAQTTATASNLSAGIYNLTVTDALDCSNTINIVLGEPTALELSTQLNASPLCNGDNQGEVQVIATGGTLPYQYQWNDPMGQTSAIASSLGAGSYEVTITDANLCTNTATIEVDEPTALQIVDVITQVPSCVGDQNASIEVLVEGGVGNYQFTWNGGSLPNSNLISNLGSGLYLAEIVDANGCFISLPITVDEPEALFISSISNNPVTCNSIPNGVLEISATGGDQNLSYNWSNGANEANNTDLVPGTYQLTITDGMGCELLESFEIISTDTETLDLGSADTLICKDNLLYYDFTASNYVDFRWSNDNGEVLSELPIYSSSEEGSYYFYARRDDGCEILDTINVAYSNHYLDAFYIAPTDIVIGDTIIALELTQPVPDSVTWEFDGNQIDLTGRTGNQHLFAFNELGEYDLTMTSYLDGCTADITKTIYVYADSMDLPFVNPLVPTILGALLFPNPTTGDFSIEVRLSGELDMVIDIYSDQSVLIDRSSFTGSNIYTSEYNLTLTPGIYYARMQVAGTSLVLTFVVGE